MFKAVYKNTIWIFNNIINHILTPLTLKKGVVNCHKKSFICKSVRLYDSSIDKYSYVGKYSVMINTTIGRFCSIAGHCSFGLGNHTSKFISTSPIFTQKRNGTHITWIKKDVIEQSLLEISIGHDVWIGEHAIIMDGIKVGHGAIIGAGAIVTKDIPPYAVVVGIPAKVIKYRFNEDIIARLLKIRWWDFPEDIIIQNISLFQTDQIKIEELEKLADRQK